MFLSLEFGSNIKIVEGCKKKNIVYVKKAVTMDVSVDIKNGLNLSDSINEVLIKNNIKTKKAIIIINTESVIIRKIKLPFLKKKTEIATMIKHELGQLISADLSRYKIIYKIIEIYNEDEKKTALYAAYCLPLNTYEFYESLGKKLKLKLIRIDISSNSLNNILEQNIELNNSILNRKDVCAFVNINNDSAIFSVIYKGINDFFMIEVAERNTDIAAETTFYHGEHGIDDMYIWVEVINKCCRYYHSVNNNRISRIYLYGCSKGTCGLDKLLSAILHMEVEFINSASNMVCEENTVLNEYFISAAAMYNIKSLNFLTKDGSKAFVAICIAGASVLLILFSFLQKHELSLKEHIYDLDIYIKNEKCIEKDSMIEKLKSDNQALKASIMSMDEAIIIIDNENINTEIIKSIYYLLPQNTKVLSFSIEKDSINMQCISCFMDEVIYFLNELKEMDFVESIYIPAVQSKDMKYSYSIICNFKVIYEE